MDSSVKFHSCLQLNISACSYTEDNQNFVVTLYNPLSRPLSTYVRLPIRGYSYTVKDFTETELVTQIVPIPESIVAIPGRESNATNELIFRAINVPPLGYQSYYISENTAIQVDETSQIETGSSISNELFNVTINNTGHVLTSWRNGNSMEFAQSFHYYEGSVGNNREFKNRSSGAYIFRPKNSNAKSLTSSQSRKIYKGPLVEEIHQTINKWVSQVIRLYIGEDHVEFNWLVGPIPVDDHVGKEVITRYSSDLETHGTFYTDSNGREMMKRMKNYRPTWNLQLEEPVAGNYYPVTSKISIKEKNNAHRLSVLTDRSEGGTSLNDGEIELMLHRRLLSDDAFGVGEALNEEAFGKGLVAIGQHYIVGGTEDDSIPMKEKNLAMQLLLRPWTLITPANDISFEQWAHNYKMASTGIAKNLPPNLHILTLEPWMENSILLRLEHIYEIGEDPMLSQPVEINIQDLFVPFNIVSVHETTLGGNQWLKDMDRLIWKAESNDIVRELGSQDRPERQENDDETSSDAINVLLHPMQIRTLIIGIEPSQ